MRRAVLVATVIAVAAVTGGAAHAAAAELPPPVPHGALRIAGTPRDGATVSASGLRWRPGRLPHGDARLARSCEFGATDVFLMADAGRSAATAAIDRVAQVTGGVLADLVVEAVGHEEQQFNLACALARNKGRVLYFGIPPDRMDGVAFEAVVRKSLTIHTSVPEDLRPFVTIAQRMIKSAFRLLDRTDACACGRAASVRAPRYPAQLRARPERPSPALRSRRTRACLPPTARPPTP